MNNHPINHDDMTGQHIYSHKNCWVPPYNDHGHLNSLDIHGHLDSLDNTHTVDISSFGFVTNE